MPSLHLQLRRSTGQSHDKLERYPFFQAWTDGDLPLESYVAWLRLMTVLVGVLEQEVEASSDPAVRHLWREEMRKLPLLHADVSTFDAEPTFAASAMEPALELVDSLRRWSGQDAAKLIGALYVFEGSTLGSRVLRDRVATQYGLSGEGLAYVSAYGSSVLQQWKRFCERLDGLDLSEECAARVVETATTVFDMLGETVKLLYPVEADRRAAANALNREAGLHEVTNDPREALAAIDAGPRTWQAYPYYEARYGERGRAFNRSDSAWLVMLCQVEDDLAFEQIDWLANVLASRGMPSLLLEEHLAELQASLARAVPERADRYARLGTINEHLKNKRVAALPSFARVAESFSLSEPLANVGPIIAGAVADERAGIGEAAHSAVVWLTDPERFPEQWIKAVRRTIAQAKNCKPVQT